MEFEKLTKLNNVINNPHIYKNKKNIINETPHKNIETMKPIFINKQNQILNFSKNIDIKYNKKINIFNEKTNSKDDIINSEIYFINKINFIFKKLKEKNSSKNELLINFNKINSNIKAELKKALLNLEDNYNICLKYYNTMFNSKLELNNVKNYKYQKQLIYLNYYKKQSKDLKIENERLINIKVKNNKEIDEFVKKIKYNNYEINNNNLSWNKELLILKNENSKLKFKISSLNKEIISYKDKETIISNFKEKNLNSFSNFNNKISINNIMTDNIIKINNKDTYKKENNITINNANISITKKDRTTFSFNENIPNNHISWNKFKQSKNIDFIKKTNKINFSLNNNNKFLKKKITFCFTKDTKTKKSNDINILELYNSNNSKKSRDNSINYIKNKDYIKEYINKSIDKSFKSSYLHYDNGKIVNIYQKK